MAAYGYRVVLERGRRQLAEARASAKRGAAGGDDVRWCWDSCCDGDGFFASRVAQCLPQRCLPCAGSPGARSWRLASALFRTELAQVLADLQARLAATTCPLRPLRVALGDVEVAFPNLREAVRVLESLTDGSSARSTPRSTPRSSVRSSPRNAQGALRAEADEAQPGHERCTCAVCLRDLAPGEALWRLPCGHEFHPSCVHKWLLRSECCPNCRGHVTKKLIRHELGRVMAQ